MSVSANPERSYPVDYGLPPRPPTASTPLWEHLLHPKGRVLTSMADIAAVAPPLGPLDKNATSMRILLHDTQSNFEKFGKHVGQLFEEIKHCKTEMKAIHSRFESDRESLMGDIIDLVNRSQKETQKSIGTPVQCQQVETIFKDVEHRLSGLDQRLDSIQSFNQTHTQALQTQIQAVQLLLDKQASIIAAVLPLLPLLQSVPLHIDTVKSSLNETLAKFISSLTELKETHGPGLVATVITTDISPAVNKTTKRKRIDVEKSPSTISTTPAPESPLQKKSRKEEISKDFAETTHETSSSASKTSRNKITPVRNGPSAALHPSPVETTHVSSRKNNNDLISTVGVSPIPDTTAPISSGLGSRRGTFAVPKFATPRRPLSDLPVVPPSRPSSIQRNPSILQRTTREMSLERSNTLASVFSMRNLTGMTPTAARPPRILRVHTSFANSSKATSRPNVDPLGNSKTYTASSSAGLSSSHLSGLPQSLDVKREVVEMLPLPESTNCVASTSASPGLEIPPGKPRSVFSRQKDRRSPLREGRRFIPLVDSEDEEENAM